MNSSNSFLPNCYANTSIEFDIILNIVSIINYTAMAFNLLVSTIILLLTRFGNIPGFTFRTFIYNTFIVNELFLIFFVIYVTISKWLEHEIIIARIISSKFKSFTVKKGVATVEDEHLGLDTS